MLREEDYAESMEGRGYAAEKDAQTKLGLEECASGMEQNATDAAVKEVLNKLRMEECA